VSLVIATTILYLPIGRKTFDLAAGEEVRAASSAWLSRVCEQVIEPDAILTSVDELAAFLRTIDASSVDAVLYQSVTFADGEFVRRALEDVEAPYIVWSVREPSTRGRLRLNSLTGGNSTCNVLRNLRHPFSFVFGNPSEEELQNSLVQQFGVNRLLRKLRELTIGVIGEHPPGFFFSDADESLLARTFGVRLHKFDLERAFRECARLPESEYTAAMERAERQVAGLNRSDETVRKFAQFYTYVRKQIEAERVRAIAVRCWPEFFTELGAAACSTLSQFTEDGVMSSCESDIHGALSMVILHELSGGAAPYLGDLVHVDESRNSVVFWHCGAGAYSLAHPATGARAGVHPNRKLGFAMDFGLKPGGVTIFRVSCGPDGYRLLVMKGEALDSPQSFHGTSVEVRLPSDVRTTLTRLMHEGFEPHFALVYADVSDALVELGRRLGIQTMVLA